MRLLWDIDGVNIADTDYYSTVQDLLHAVDVFLQKHPLDCGSCRESCCQRPWSVEVDNVCLGRLCGNKEEVGAFIRNKLILKQNPAKGFPQYVLNKKTNCPFVTQDNRCTIYSIRPIICRLYVCCAKSSRYNALREAVAAVFLEALVLEEAMRNAPTPRTNMKYERNPAIHARDYHIQLYDIVTYAGEKGWLDAEDEQELIGILR